MEFLIDFWPLALAGLVGATLAGVTGFGGAAILLPVLVHFFGVKETIPILTVAQLIGNGSRVWLHRTQLSWRVVAYYAIGAIPSALAGGFFFAHAPVKLLMKFLGLFLLATVGWRWLKAKKMGVVRVERQDAPPDFSESAYGGRGIVSFPLRGFAGVGAVFGFLSALVGGVGPFIVPFFLAHGLVKGAFIGTEALCTVVMHIFKMVAYRQTNLLTWKIMGIGLALGPLMILGSWLGKKILYRLPERVFVILVEITLLAAGLGFLLKG